MEFLEETFAQSSDARLFEVVSFCILKQHYSDQTITFLFEDGTHTKENLTLYKTGRTNANDGGIDFVLKPLGRFFQVTETLDFKKYFLCSMGMENLIFDNNNFFGSGHFLIHDI